MSAFIDGTVKDQTGVPVVGAEIYVYGNDGELADLVNDVGQAVPQPLVSGEDGYYSAYAADDGFYTLEFYWGGRLRYVVADRPAGERALADAAAVTAAQRAEESAAAGASTLIETQEAFEETVTFTDRAEAAMNQAIAAALDREFFPAARDYVPQGLASVAIEAAGADGTDGTYTVGLTGDNLIYDAQISVTVSGGAITEASVAGPGYYVGAAIDLGSADLSSITGLTGATLTLTEGVLVASGETYLTDHATQTDVPSLFVNNGGAALEVMAEVDFLNIALARSYAEKLAELWVQYRVGRQVAPAEGTSGVANAVYTWTRALEHDVRVLGVGAYNGNGASKTVKLRADSRNTGTGVNTRQVEGPVVTLPPGNNLVMLAEPVDMAKGLLPGVYAELAAFDQNVNESGDEGGHYVSASGAEPVSYTSASPTVTVRLEIYLLVEYLHVTGERVLAIESELSSATVNSGAAKAITDAFSKDMVIGHTAPSVQAAAIGNRVYVFDKMIPADGYAREFRGIFAYNTTISLGRWKPVGAGWALQGDWLEIEVEADTVIVVPESVVAALQPKRGEYMGIFGPTNSIYYANSSGEGAGWVASPNNGGIVSSFTDITAKSNLALQCGFVVRTASADAASTEATETTPKARKGYSAISLFNGRVDYAFPTSGPVTMRNLRAARGPFVGVQLILRHSGLGPVPIAKAVGMPVANVAEFASSAKWTADALAFTFDGQESVVVPGARGAQEYGLIESDILWVNALARTDGSGPLFASAIYAEELAGVKMLGKSDGATDFTSWADGDDVWIARHDAGDCIATPGDFADATNQSTTIIAGYRFHYLQPARTHMILGDSIDEGHGAGIDDAPDGRLGHSFAYLGVRDRDAASGTIWESACIAWSGSAHGSFVRRLESTLAAGLVPDSLSFPVYTPNSYGAALTADAAESFMDELVGPVLDLCGQHCVHPIPRTGIPTDPNVHNLDGNDANRVALNEYFRALQPDGLHLLDLDAVLRGVVDGDGQTLLISDANDAIDVSDDGVHPDKSGHEKGGVPMVAALAGSGLEPSGGLYL